MKAEFFKYYDVAITDDSRSPVCKLTDGTNSVDAAWRGTCGDFNYAYFQGAARTQYLATSLAHTPCVVSG